MKRKTTSRVLLLSGISLLLATGFGPADFGGKLPDIATDKDCESSADRKKCEKKQKVKTGATVMAAGIAAKLIRDMVIEYKAQQTTSEERVVADYKKRRKQLPAVAEVVEYSSTLKPGTVVNAGNQVKVDSSLIVVPGKDGKVVEIKEQIDIYDNDDHNKVLKSLTKVVNEGAKKAGAYRNEFMFTLPVGMPQGIYPVKTAVLLNGKVAKPSNNKMQLVLHVDDRQRYKVAVVQKY